MSGVHRPAAHGDGLDQAPYDESTVLEEENKFGDYSEKLQKVELNITNCQGQIVAQHKLVDRLKSDGGDCSLAERLLANMY